MAGSYLERRSGRERRAGQRSHSGLLAPAILAAQWGHVGPETLQMCASEKPRGAVVISIA